MCSPSCLVNALEDAPCTTQFAYEYSEYREMAQLEDASALPPVYPGKEWTSLEGTAEATAKDLVAQEEVWWPRYIFFPRGVISSLGFDE